MEVHKIQVQIRCNIAKMFVLKASLNNGVMTVCNRIAFLWQVKSFTCQLTGPLAYMEHG
jgi:hypothetical protein